MVCTEESRPAKVVQRREVSDEQRGVPVRRMANGGPDGAVKDAINAAGAAIGNYSGDDRAQGVDMADRA